MDFDYEGSEDFGGRILWPRIAVFGVALILFFILGRCTAGGGDVSQDEFDEVVASQSESAALLAERDALITELRQRLLEVEAGPTTTPGTDPGAGTGGTGTETPGDGGGTQTDETGARTYEVQAGDTLSTIAQAVYGDPSAFGIIASANNLSGDQPLQVGQTLTIPPNPDQ